jgi:hypothetical protein
MGGAIGKCIARSLFGENYCIGFATDGVVVTESPNMMLFGGQS